ncbi:MAG: diguanylate cyclase, partial [Gammaproteobacteria bacterium]
MDACPTLKRKEAISWSAARRLLMVCLCLLLSGHLAAREFIVQLKWHHQFQFAGYYAALHQGYYDQAGLDVTLKPIQPGLDLVAEVTSGRADFAISNTGLLESWAKGEPIVALAAIMQHSPGAFIGIAGRKIRTPSDLIGARVMVPKAQQGGELVTLLHHLGLQDRIQKVPPSYDIRDLIEDRVDLYNGYISNEPFTLIEQGLEPLIINPRDYGVDFYADVLFTRRGLIDDAPEDVEAFRQATLKGWRYALEHKNELVQLILNQYAQNASPAKLTYEANTLETLMLSEVVDIGHMSRVRWEKIRDQLANLGMIPKNLSLDGFLYEPRKSVGWGVLMPWAIGLGALFLTALAILTWVARSNIRLSREVSERRRAEERAFYLATHDPLTDLPNRSLLSDRLKKLLNRARRYELTPALLFMDLDNFK